MTSLIDTAREARDMLARALEGPRVAPLWSRSGAAEWVLIGDIKAAGRVRRQLDALRQGADDGTRNRLAYTAATIGLDGYCHYGRATSSVAQLTTLLREHGAEGEG